MRWILIFVLGFAFAFFAFVLSGVFSGDKDIFFINSSCLGYGEGFVVEDYYYEEDSLNRSCCEGLVEISIAEEFDGKCFFSASEYYEFRCAPCGDGVCQGEFGENICTCEKDCF